MYYILFACMFFISTCLVAEETRRSNSGICHEKGYSPYFEQTGKKFTFDSIEACLASSKKARLPKGVVASNIAKATQEADNVSRAYTSLYNRKDWPHWKQNVDGCLNARHALLKERSLIPALISKCSVKQGRWYGIYLDRYFTQSSDVDIDHVVPLKAAHQRGGYSWSRSQREKFANDPENLLIVDDATNQAKGAKTPANWMPPNKQYRCQYLSHFDRIMSKYQLSYLSREKRIIERMKKSCEV